MPARKDYNDLREAVVAAHPSLYRGKDYSQVGNV